MKSQAIPTLLFCTEGMLAEAQVLILQPEAAITLLWK